MRQLLTASILLLSFGLFSCQKEVDDIFAGTDNGGTAAGSLKRWVITDGSDSTATDFFYNNNGRIIGINNTIVESGVTSFDNQEVKRNSQGLITAIITRASDLSQLGIDSIVSEVSSSAGRYTQRVLKFSLSGFDVTFTTVYSYDANGRIASEKDYIDDGTGNVDSSRIDYEYAGSNVVSLKGYDLSSGSSTPDLVELFEYDSKPSPLIAGNEAFVLNNFLFWASVNNITKITVTTTGDPDTHIETFNYSYNSHDRPTSASVVQDGQTGLTATYYYN